MIRRFFSWWFRELGELLPGHRAAQSPDHQLRVSPEANGLRLTQVRRQRERTLGQLLPNQPVPAKLASRLRAMAHKHAQVAIDVAPEHVLEKRIRLPAAASANLREVIRYEIERLSPFRHDEVIYGANVVGDPTPDGIIDVVVRIVQSRAIGDVPHALEPFGFALDAVSASVRADDTRVFVQYGSPQIRSRSLSAFSLGIWAFNAALLVASVTYLFGTQQQQIDALETKIGELRVRAADTAAKIEAFNQAVAQRDAIFAARISAPPMVNIVEEISRLLPDDTVLDRLEVRRNTLTLRGHSGNAAALIALLERSKFLSDVRFRSPVLRRNPSDAEEFHLTAELTTEFTEASGA